MKETIIRINLQRLKNETHVQFNENINAVFVKYNPQTLNIKALYDLYKAAFDNEIEALDFIRKSELTTKIANQDHRRDTIYRGFVETIKGEIHHFDQEHVEAAELLYEVCKHYGNIARKTLDDETAAIDDLLRELDSNGNKSLVELLGLADWLDQLEVENNRFKQLMLDRYAETSQRPAIRMCDARTLVDRCLRLIFDRIDALALVNGITAFESFIKELNAVIERYKNLIARGKGDKKEQPVD
ncbi:MAG: DUF6261 family protein [Prevotellaceae bacterium]|jgi:hypothetical protein|nr:DUF6261 family protein [Prevotellaceae bacterium]